MYYTIRKKIVMEKIVMECFREMTMELQKLKLECEHLKNCQERLDQEMHNHAKMTKEFQSQSCSLISNNGSQNQQIHSFFLDLLKVCKEKDELRSGYEELKRENEYLKNLRTQQQPVDFETNDQILNLPKPSQPMQTTDSTESERHPTWGNRAKICVSEGAKTLNMGLHTGTGCGDIEAGQSPATKAEKKSRQGVERLFCSKRKANFRERKEKLEHYYEISNELRDLRKETENSWKHEELMIQQMQEEAELSEDNESFNKLAHAWPSKLLKVYNEKDELKKENEDLKEVFNPTTSDPSACGYDPSACGYDPITPVDMTGLHHVDFDCDIDFNQVNAEDRDKELVWIPIRSAFDPS